MSSETHLQEQLLLYCDPEPWRGNTTTVVADFSVIRDGPFPVCSHGTSRTSDSPRKRNITHLLQQQ